MIMALFTHLTYRFLDKTDVIGEYMMFTPIIKQKISSKDADANIMPKKDFDDIIKKVYEIMVDYCRIQDTFINKSHPMQVGNVIFWFETDEKTNESYIKYDRNIVAWDQESIISDIDLHMHSLYYNPKK
jgi:hypothetical protein